MKLLRDQSLPQNLLDNVFQSLRISKIRYGLPVWGGYVSASRSSSVVLPLNFGLLNVYYIRYIHSCLRE